MKKLKIQQRIENSVNAFFDENLPDGKNIAAFNAAYVSRQEKKFSNADTNVDVVKILKQLFVYFPSAFYLFFGTMAFFMYGYVTSNRLVILSWLVISFMMMVFGIGSLKNPKHFLMPLSVVGLAIVTFLIFSASGIPTHIWSQKYAVYVFPLALIVPFLVKGLVDKDSSIENS